MKRLTEAERQRIISLLQSGKSQKKVSQISGRSFGTVNAIAKNLGLKPIDQAKKTVSAVAQDYSKAGRIKLLNEAFEHAKGMLPTIEDGREFQAWMIAVATAIDKRRLEDGEATSRSEQVNGESRARIKQHLAEVVQLKRDGESGNKSSSFG